MKAEVASYHFMLLLPAVDLFNMYILQNMQLLQPLLGESTWKPLRWLSCFDYSTPIYGYVMYMRYCQWYNFMIKHLTVPIHELYLKGNSYNYILTP
jgi:hypothetical protein